MNSMKPLFAAFLTLATPALAAQSVSVEGLISLVIYVVIIGLIFWCVWWFIGYVGVPEPFNKVIRVVLGLIALLVVVSILLSLIGRPVFVFR